jgi:hypothetical protein
MTTFQLLNELYFSIFEKAEMCLARAQRGETEREKAYHEGAYMALLLQAQELENRLLHAHRIYEEACSYWRLWGHKPDAEGMEIFDLY